MEILSWGDRGPLVYLLQLILNRLGFNAGPVDGIFGFLTYSAVKRLQEHYNLRVDGIVGPQTWGVLRPYTHGYFVHTISPGDTFLRIAQLYNTDTTAIATANPGVQPTRLVPGSSLIIPTGQSVVFTDVPYSSTILEINLQGLKIRYPFLEVSSIGSSVLGKELKLVKIGSGAKKVFYNASHHANEWITSVVLMKFIEDYASALSQNTAIFGENARQLAQRITLYLAVMVNPDGVDLVTGEIPRGSAPYNAARRMNNPPVPFPSGWKANISGVDLNVNYPARWEEARRIKFAMGYTAPGPRDYVGPYPLSEPETQAMASFTRENEFLLTLSYHTQGAVIYWKFADYEPEHSFQIGQRMSQVSGYDLEITPSASGNAGYKDWFIQDFNKPGYTIEAGRGTSPLPLEQFPEIYEDNLGILVLGMSLAAELL